MKLRFHRIYVTLYICSNYNRGSLSMIILPGTPTTKSKSINSKWFNAGLLFSSLTDNINTYNFGEML